MARGRKPKSPQRYTPGGGKSSSTKSSTKSAGKSTSAKSAGSGSVDVDVEVPPARTWVYAATGTDAISNEGYELYLNNRVQRPLARGVGGTYAGNGEQSNLSCAHVPLPPLDELPGKPPAEGEIRSDDYSKFTAPIVAKDSRAATFRYSLNHGTHVKGKNVMAYVGQGDSGYVLQLPLVKGTVIGYSPPLDATYDQEDEGAEPAEQAEFPTERQRADEPLFRILWEGHTAIDGKEEGDDDKTDVIADGTADAKAEEGDEKEDGETNGDAAAAVGYTEDVTLAELLPCLVTPPPGLTSHQKATHKKQCPPPYSHAQHSFPYDASDGSPVVIPAKLLSATAASVHKHVHATVTRRQLALEWKMEHGTVPHLVVLAALELRKEMAQKVRLEILLERKRLRMASGVEKDKTKKKRGEGVVNADGKELGYYARHPNQYMSSFQPPPPLPSDDEESDSEDEDDGGHHHKKRSKTKLTEAELVTYHAKLEEQCHLAPSKIAERAKLACSMAYEYASREGLLDEYYAESERRKERERDERERVARQLGAVEEPTGGGGRSRGPGGIDGTGEVRRSGRARTSVNYAEDGATEREVEAALRREEAATGPRKAVVVGGVPRENVSGGPTARYLLDLLGMMPEEEGTDAETGAEEDAEEEEEHDDGEDEEVEEKPGENDPFFEPDPRLILDQLGRKGRYLSPAAVQAAIVFSIHAEPVETPACLLDEEDAEDGHHHVTDLVCTSGDKVSDLGHFEPSSFSRCRFAPRTFVPEGDEEMHDENDEDVPEDAAAAEEKRQRREERRKARRAARKAAEQKRNAELEREYRARKAYELWRFRSVHGDGCASFPSWEERSKELLRELMGSDEAMADEAAVGGVADAAVTTSAESVPSEAAAAPEAQDDEALARSLAADAADDEPLAKRRRTARRAAAGGDTFYGGHSAMSREQLLDALVRLVRNSSAGHAVGSMSLMDLKRAVFPDNYDTSRGGVVEMKKLRSAIGQLVHRLGRIGKLMVDVDGDEACLDLLGKEGALVKFITDNAEDVQATEQPTVVADVSDGANGAAAAPAVASAPAQPPAPPMDEHLRSQLQALEGYVGGLHRTELTLRKALMKAIDKGIKKDDGGDAGAGTLLQISTLAIAVAADETEGAADSEDWRYFLPKKGENGDKSSDEVGEKIKWSSDVKDHAFLGKVIYRPQSSPLRPAATEAGAASDQSEKCHWYRIISYTPSVKAVEVLTADGKPQNPLPEGGDKEARPNIIVERRMRFRAVPVAESDIDAPPSAMDMDADDDDIEYMVLTEAQAKAGMEAATVWRKISGGGTKQSTVASNANANQAHPYRNGHGSRVMLTPQPSDNGSQFEVLYGVIAGYDHSNEDGTLKYRLLVLLENDDDENKEGEGEKKSCAFWSTVDPKGTTLTEISLASPDTVSPSLCSSYAVEMHAYYQGSPAYNVCESVLTYLKNHSKSGPFLHPVDPVALGIPDYPTVIKNPMDISTVAQNLEDGKYSRIPPKAMADDAEEEEEYMENPVYKMAYGPFYNDVMLIFDNCIKYNGEATWIGNEALILKKNTIKKMEQLVNKALWQGGGASSKASSGGASSRRAASKSVYAEVDSDVDMYEYESEYDDDEYGGGGRRKSRKARGKSGGGGSKRRPAKEDISANAIERPFAVPENAHEFGTGGPFPDLKIQTNVGKFTLSSQEWSCRYIKEDADDADAGEGEAEEEDPAEDEMLMLMQMQQEEDAGGRVRRSTRERHAPKNYADEEDVPSATAAPSYAPQTAVTLPGVEYYLTNEEVLQSKKMSEGEEGAIAEGGATPIPTTCRSRLSAEGIQEVIHEQFYARLYRDHSPNALILDSGLGKYVEGSFPPYLGRIVPSGNATNGDGPVVWEIREPYLVPALRWILRGLVRSGHLAEVDGSLSEGILDDAPARTSFSSGIVVPCHEYYYSGATSAPFDVLDEKEILRKRRQEAAAAESDSSSEAEVELSAYEQMRAERVKRNAERLKALGLA